MPHPVTPDEILAALESNARTIAGYFSSLPDSAFFDGDSDRWSPAHHLVHLTVGSAAVAKALRSATLPMHPTGRSRTYAEVRDAAASSLGATPRDTLRDMGRTVVVAPADTKAERVRAFVSASADLRSAAREWSEEALDRHALTHPLMGVLTVREMLLFQVVHERHHLRLVQTRVAASGAAGETR